MTSPYSTRAYSHFQHKCRSGNVYGTSKSAPKSIQGRVFLQGDTNAAQSIVDSLHSNGFTDVKKKHIVQLPKPCTPEQFESLLLTTDDGVRHDQIPDDMLSDGGILRRGMYSDQLDNYMKYYPKDQLMVLLTEELFSDFVGVMADIQSFLGLPYFDYSTRAYKNERGFTVLEGLKSKASKAAYEPVSESMLSKLARYYMPHHRKLARYVGKDRLIRYWKLDQGMFD